MPQTATELGRLFGFVVFDAGAPGKNRTCDLGFRKGPAASDLAAPLRVVDAGSRRRECSKILARHVRGSFFVEYVRMIRRRKDVDWMGELRVEDLALVQQRIVPEAWYPMASFERLGLAILGNFPGAGLEAVRMWGNYSAHQFVRDHATLLAEGRSGRNVDAAARAAPRCSTFPLSTSRR